MIKVYLNKILSEYNLEELYFANKIFFYCMKVSDDDFEFEDFSRNLKTYSKKNLNKKSFLLLQLMDLEDRLTITKTDFIEFLKISGLRDYCRNYNLDDVFEGVFPQSEMLKAKLFENISEDESAMKVINSLMT